MTTDLPVIGAANLARHLASGGRASWEAVAALAEAFRPETWMVIGGQMVAIHAARVGVDMVRATTDIDVVVDVRAQRREHARRLSGWLVESGFEVSATTREPTGFDGATLGSISLHPTISVNRRW